MRARLRSVRIVRGVQLTVVALVDVALALSVAVVMQVRVRDVSEWWMVLLGVVVSVETVAVARVGLASAAAGVQVQPARHVC